MIAIYLVVDNEGATGAFRNAYTDPEPAKLAELLEKPINTAFAVPGSASVVFELGKRVSNERNPFEWIDKSDTLRTFDAGDNQPDPLASLYVSILIDDTGSHVLVDEEALRTFKAQVPGAQDASADLAFQTTFVPIPGWCRRAGQSRGFGTRSDALRALGQDFLGASGYCGQGVNIVIVDQGLDGGTLGANFRGGWPIDTRRPGQLRHLRGVTYNDHGMLIARNCLAVAPQARLFDCPLIPDRIENVDVFLSTADAQLSWVRFWILVLRLLGWFPGPWLVVNAWAIFDRSSENPRGHYSENSAHRFNVLMRRFAEAGIDVIFAAGNCGQFCPDIRCGDYDIGPGQSIFGAHAHASVLTVGAVRADGLWAGSSSQGPGPATNLSGPGLVLRKPDLCAPSFFADAHDAHTFNGGTSTACALAAGVVAALRSAPALRAVPTAVLFQALRQSAVRAGPPGWDARLGFGVLNARGAFEQFP